MTFLHGLSSCIRLVAGRPRPRTAAVILAGGAGTRMGIGTPKQWLLLGGRPVLWHSLSAFERSDYVDDIVVVCRPEDKEKTKQLIASSGFSKVRRLTGGGATRQRSAYNGARCVPEGTRFIAIHDAARCLVTSEQIDAVISRAYAVGAASLGIPVRDTVKVVNSEGYITKTLDRDMVFLAATPQVFSYPMYISAATSALREGLSVTDDNGLIESLGQRVAVVPVSSDAMKLTVPGDIALAESILAARNKADEKKPQDSLPGQKRKGVRKAKIFKEKRK